MSGYDNFITPVVNRVKHRNGAEALSNDNNLAEPGPNMGLVYCIPLLPASTSVASGGLGRAIHMAQTCA